MGFTAANATRPFVDRASGRPAVTSYSAPSFVATASRTAQNDKQTSLDGFDVERRFSPHKVCRQTMRVNGETREALDHLDAADMPSGHIAHQRANGWKVWLEVGSHQDYYSCHAKPFPMANTAVSDGTTPRRARHAARHMAWGILQEHRGSRVCGVGAIHAGGVVTVPGNRTV